MRPSPWSPALLAALLLAGCKSEKPAAPAVQDSGPPAAAAVATPPVPAPVPVPKPPAEPAHSLSFLQPSDPERCEWVRQPLPSGEPIHVFSFNGACDRSMVSWSPDGKEGLVFTWPSGTGEVPKAWRVDVATHTGKVLDLKPLPGGKDVGEQDKPYIEEVSFDEQGRPVAIIADVYVKRTPQKGKGGQKTLSYEGQSYPLQEGVEGLPGLAHAFRLEEGSWKHVETKASGFESDLAPGTHELETVKTLGTIAKASAPEHGLPGGDAPQNVAAKLDAAFPGQDETGQWMMLSTPGGPVYFRGVQGGETLYPSVPVAWEQGGKLVELEGLLAKTDDVIDLQAEEGLLLVAGYGDPRAAQLWDIKTKQRVFSAADASAPAFWPKPASPK
jgi:hypothetical protein